MVTFGFLLQKNWWQGPTNGTLLFYECRLSGGYTQRWWGHSNRNSICLNYLHSQAMEMLKHLLMPARNLLSSEPPGEIFTTRNEVGARLYFHRCLSFCSQGGVPGQVPPPPGTPPGTRYFPGTRYTLPRPGAPPRTRYTSRTRYTPWDQVHTPPQTRYPPQELCMLGDTGNKRAVRILLECILVTI